MSLKTTNKNKKQYEAASAAMRDSDNGSDTNKKTMVCMSYEYITIQHKCPKKTYFMVESVKDLIYVLLLEKESK